MQANKLIELIEKQGRYSAALNSHLQQVLTSEPFLIAARNVLAEAQALHANVAITLPSPDKVLEIAYMQGRAAGIIGAFEALAKLTEFTEETKNVNAA